MLGRTRSGALRLARARQLQRAAQAAFQMIKVAARRIVLGPQTSLPFFRQHVRDQKKAVLHVVEGQHVGKIHEDRIVQIDVGGNARGQALQHAHGFIRKITHGAGSEGRQAGNLHGLVTRAQSAQEFKDVARVLFAVRSAPNRDLSPRQETV